MPFRATPYYIYISLAIIALLWPHSLSAQRTEGVVFLPKDSVRVERLLAEAPKDAGTLWFARQFLNTPYVAHTLEIDSSEPLVVNLHELDCTTFVETVLALTYCHVQGYHTFSEYCDVLTNLRYRDGCRNGYLSRLHYFHWWAKDNAARHNIIRISDKRLFTKPLVIANHYMSVHPGQYKMLRNDTLSLAKIKLLEQQDNGPDGYYMPQEKTRLLRPQLSAIHEGDIIAIVTSKDGLDYAHLGFAFFDNKGRLHMLHASSVQKRVIADPLPLYQYLLKRPSFLGISVFRATNGNQVPQ